MRDYVKRQSFLYTTKDLTIEKGPPNPVEIVIFEFAKVYVNLLLIVI
jgi:hypothetical protein